VKKQKPQERMLTDVELELMNILWRLGEGSVAAVIEALPKERELAYTSVSTILRILEQKNVLSARKEGRGHTYVPRLKKSEYESKAIKHVVDKVFDGTPVALVKQLLDTGGLNHEELDELKKLLTQSRSKK
jgi:predicted transcriptional regulator